MFIDWNHIDTVLLDMDGTILDRHFDDHFWLEHVPRTYAARHGIPLDSAKDTLYALFRSQEMTLNWTDLDYWSERLGLDIPLLKREVDHLIAVHPFVVTFLRYLRQHGKAVHLVTNAHGETLDLKMGKTRLGPYFHRVISAHDIGLLKEDVRFWTALRSRVDYDPARTLLGEDSETNLETARQAGIGFLVYISGYSSSVAPVASPRFPSVRHFGELLPAEE